jgi:hypothetical protein
VDNIRENASLISKREFAFFVREKIIPISATKDAKGA